MRRRPPNPFSMNPIRLDMEKAQRLFVPDMRAFRVDMDFEKAREIFLPCTAWEEEEVDFEEEFEEDEWDED